MSALRTLLLLLSCGTFHCNSNKPLIAGEVVRFPNPLAFKSGGDPVYGEAVQRWPVGFDGRNVVEHLARTTSDGRWWEMAPRGLLTNQVTYIQKAELMGVLTPPIWRVFLPNCFKTALTVLSQSCSIIAYQCQLF